MNKPVISSGKFAALSGKRTLVIGACVCAALIGSATSVHAQIVVAPAPSPPVEVVAPAPEIPNHLVIGNQIFEANVTGLRDYIESIRATDPQLYSQLAPDVERLESRQSTAQRVLVAGAVAGLASGIYAFAGQGDCQEPSISDPNFAGKLDAWGSCNEHKIKMMATFGFIGVGAIIAGGLAASHIAPNRSDLLEVVNKNNRQSREPLRLELGYDPSHQLAFAGAALTF
jgi:hypothetical protein